MKNLSTISKLTLFTAIAGLAITLISLFTVFLGYPGWTIGIAIGSVVDVAIVALLYVGGDQTARSQKAGVTVLFYFLRVLLLAAALIVPAVLDYKLGIECMKYSTFGVAIGYLPGIFTVIIVMTKSMNDAKEDNK